MSIKSVIPRILKVNVPEVATKLLKFRKANDKKIMTLSSNWLPLSFSACTVSCFTTSLLTLSSLLQAVRRLTKRWAMLSTCILHFALAY